jgi:type IV secretory pathway VirB4 component
LVLDDPAFAQQLREWLKTLRKKNASVVFAPQSLSDIAAPPGTGSFKNAAAFFAKETSR